MSRPAAGTSTGRTFFVDMPLRWRDLPNPTIAAQCRVPHLRRSWMIASAMDLILSRPTSRWTWRRRFSTSRRRKI
jgi:hypothetical protein